jgi:hypothetical protein
MTAALVIVPIAWDLDIQGTVCTCRQSLGVTFKHDSSAYEMFATGSATCEHLEPTTKTFIQEHSSVQAKLNGQICGSQR